jgi:hypothetical protein
VLALNLFAKGHTTVFKLENQRNNIYNKMFGVVIIIVKLLGVVLLSKRAPAGRS